MVGNDFANAGSFSEHIAFREASMGIPSTVREFSIARSGRLPWYGPIIRRLPHISTGVPQFGKSDGAAPHNYAAGVTFRWNSVCHHVGQGAWGAMSKRANPEYHNRDIAMRSLQCDVHMTH